MGLSELKIFTIFVLLVTDIIIVYGVIGKDLY